jgi:hypothetical protein
MSAIPPLSGDKQTIRRWAEMTRGHATCAEECLLLRQGAADMNVNGHVDLYQSISVAQDHG